MKSKELLSLIKVSYDQVGRNGRDAARIYHAVVELDGQVKMWRKRAEDAGWSEDDVENAQDSSNGTELATQ